MGANPRHQPRVPCGHHWLTGRGAHLLIIDDPVKNAEPWAANMIEATEAAAAGGNPAQGMSYEVTSFPAAGAN